MDLSFVSLKNGQILVGRGAKTYLKEPHPTAPSWYSPDFFLQSSDPWYTHETYEVVDRFQFPKKRAYLGAPTPFKEMYKDMQLTKGVVYTSAPVVGFDWQSSAAYLSETSRGLYLYGTEGIMGATPELLFEQQGSRISTMALAATALEPHLLDQPKECEEHRLVVEGIVRALAPLGRVNVGEKTVLSYGTLFHALTPIEAHSDVSIKELVEVLHPTPALGAWPREEGREWLLKWDAIVPRGKFGAPFGYRFPEREETRVFVAIRCVQWDKVSLQATLWAGVGVTAQSQFDKEWEEVVQKFRNTAQRLGIDEHSAGP